MSYIVGVLCMLPLSLFFCCFMYHFYYYYLFSGQFFFFTIQFGPHFIVETASLALNWFGIIIT